MTVFAFQPSPLWQGAGPLHEAWFASEDAVLTSLLSQIQWDSKRLDSISSYAKILSLTVRDVHAKKGGMDSFMSAYDLSSDEGIALMCMAEALLRIPDSHTQNALIIDKISKGRWDEYLGTSDSLFVNAATWGLMLTGKVVDPNPMGQREWMSVLRGWLAKTSQPVVRQAVKVAMKMLGNQFVMAETIEQGLERAIVQERKGYSYSFDMLGESARTAHDAQLYFDAYMCAIHAIGRHDNLGPHRGAGISIKLSALHPRYSFSHWHTQFEVLLPQLKKLALTAKQYNMGFTIDAEEADRLELQLALLEALIHDPDLKDWVGMGLAVQAYQKRAMSVLEALKKMAKSSGTRIMVRLVKGAYWDSEIKFAQMMGYDVYPVYTRKVNTDISYLACAQFMCDNLDVFYAQFATHNAYTVSAILSMNPRKGSFEFQRLHGMGDALYDRVIADHGLPCRVYAPVGGYQYLLAYLVRRLLENGANTSFVNQVVSTKTPIEQLIAHPILQVKPLKTVGHPKVPLPKDIYGDERMNSRGLNLGDTQTVKSLEVNMNTHVKQLPVKAHPLMPQGFKQAQAQAWVVKNPADQSEILGECLFASEADVDQAFKTARSALKPWSSKPVAYRANILRAMADAMEAHREWLYTLLIKEAGKTMGNAVGEVREAVDFCRYYAQQAEHQFSKPVILQGPTGEYNQLSYSARGVMVCISPWNFPLAIFAGQIVAALVCGNTVIAKPAEQTSVIAYETVKLFYKAGLPEGVLQLLPGKGETVGAQLVGHADVAGVIFTGSTDVARIINQTLSRKAGPIVPLIAETGGQNAMIIDSSALLEQAVGDMVQSAFDSAGQRCSALRVAFVQEDIADKLLEMLKGAMDALTVGNPRELSVDVGPVIDTEAQAGLLAHIDAMKKAGHPVYQVSVPTQGIFVPPTLIELPNMSALKQEVFGPVLHVITFKAQDVDQVIQQINETGFGLTFGIHTRIERQFQKVISQVEVGNIYVNRNMVGAVVGVQPFGGQGLSGTGPKAGGPNYLMRLVHEHALSINTVAMGGNASLLSLDDLE